MQIETIYRDTLLGFFDLAALWTADISGNPNPSGSYWLPAYHGDGIHPNSAGMDAARDALIAFPTLLQEWRGL